MVYLKVHISEFSVTKNMYVGISVHFGIGIVIMRNVGIQEFTCFHPFLPFHPEITISRSLEGKYTFLGGIW